MSNASFGGHGSSKPGVHIPGAGAVDSGLAPAACLGIQICFGASIMVVPNERNSCVSESHSLPRVCDTPACWNKLNH
jgi:hypothetical protein